MKNCRNCQSEFEPSERQLKKFDYLCPPCLKEDGIRYRQSKRDRGLPVSGTRMPRSYHAKYEAVYMASAEHLKKAAENQRRYRKDNKLRPHHEARWAVAKAIKKGILSRMPCEVCGKIEVDAHHEDYSKPLDVKWLCRNHHAEHHAKARG